jgi:hypothetical protein
VVSLGSSKDVGLTVDGLGNLFYSDTSSLYEIPVGCSDPSCYLTLHTGYEYLFGQILATNRDGNIYAMDNEAQAGFVFDLHLSDPPTIPSR